MLIYADFDIYISYTRLIRRLWHVYADSDIYIYIYIPHTDCDMYMQTLTYIYIYIYHTQTLTYIHIPQTRLISRLWHVYADFDMYIFIDRRWHTHTRVQTLTCSYIYAYSHIFILQTRLIHRLWWKEAPSPPGGFPIYYVPSSRTVRKKTPSKDLYKSFEGGPLIHGFWWGNIVSRNPPRGGRFLSINFHIYMQTLTCMYTYTAHRLWHTYIHRRLDLKADFDLYMQTLTYTYICKPWHMYTCRLWHTYTADRLWRID